MILFGKQVPTFVSLALWFGAWELIGQANLSTIVPPVSRVGMAGITILASEKFGAAVAISLRSFGIGETTVVVTVFLFAVSELVAFFERRAEYWAGTR
jgi:ABC-type nitrate/sulfonate/bicarbonate transport system permease component